MSESLLIKRLHISGLTPSITPGDLERRLSSFGKVKAMDGFGAHDALGDPRKFGFVTMEIGAKELAKCLNVLSGSTWKGAKLRIGEAKPDFHERLARFNSLPPRPVRSKRTHTSPYCVSRASSPLSASAAASTPGWVVTPSGRIVRPMRMRPERPLMPMGSELGVGNRAKKRPKLPPSRARRRLINPTKWDSVYLKGDFFANDGKSELAEAPSRAVPDSEQVSEVESDDDVEMEEIDQSVTQTVVPAPSTNLKDLFAPKEDASFSLLDHLDLDLELELELGDVLGINVPASASQENSHLSQPSLSTSYTVPIPDTKPATKSHSRAMLDPSHPLLFPLLDSLPYSYTHPSNPVTTNYPRGTSACFLFPLATRVRNLHQLPPSTTFTRSPRDTSESIRERWEKDKSALTREWKKAWREARGNRRRGRGGGAEV